LGSGSARPPYALGAAHVQAQLGEVRAARLARRDAALRALKAEGYPALSDRKAAAAIAKELARFRATAWRRAPVGWAAAAPGAPGAREPTSEARRKFLIYRAVADSDGHPPEGSRIRQILSREVASDSSLLLATIPQTLDLREPHHAPQSPPQDCRRELRAAALEAQSFYPDTKALARALSDYVATAWEQERFIEILPPDTRPLRASLHRLARLAGGAPLSESALARLIDRNEAP
jgi:hypothetical protein